MTALFLFGLLGVFRLFDVNLLGISRLSNLSLLDPDFTRLRGVISGAGLADLANRSSGNILWGVDRARRGA